MPILKNDEIEPLFLEKVGNIILEGLYLENYISKLSETWHRGSSWSSEAKKKYKFKMLILINDKTEQI